MDIISKQEYCERIILEVNKLKKLALYKTLYTSDDEIVYYRKELDAIILFKQLFLLAVNEWVNNEELDITNYFEQLTKGIIDSCKMYVPCEGASWSIYIHVHNKIRKLLEIDN